MRSIAATVLTALALAATPLAWAQRWDVQAPAETSVTLGHGRTLWSSVLQEPRQLLI